VTVDAWAGRSTCEPDDDLPAVTVTAYPDGPLVLRGDFEIREVDGSPMRTGHTVALCRCGRSAVKPFCDGSHKIARALGAGAAAASPPA
jgi:CDGSH-type Zn-finger protein